MNYPEILAMQCRAIGLPAPEMEYRFHPRRKWRFDLAWTGRMIAAECDGATWTQGRHTRGKGYEADCEKMAEAALLGWSVYRFPSTWIADGRAVEYLRRAME